MKIIKLLLVAILALSAAWIVYQYRKNSFERSIISEALAANKKVLVLSGKVMKISSKEAVSHMQKKLPAGCKLIFIMNFDCSRCLVELKEIKSFQNELSRKGMVSMCLAAGEIDLGLAKFYLDKTLGDYDLWTVCQKSKANMEKLYLVDGSNRIIIKGDIIQYPFLKAEFARQFILCISNDRQFSAPTSPIMKFMKWAL